MVFELRSLVLGRCGSVRLPPVKPGVAYGFGLGRVRGGAGLPAGHASGDDVRCPSSSRTSPGGRMSSWRLVVAACCIAAAGGYAAGRALRLTLRWRRRDYRICHRGWANGGPSKTSGRIARRNRFFKPTAICCGPTRGERRRSRCSSRSMPRSGPVIPFTHRSTACLERDGNGTERRRESVTVDPGREVEINRNVATLNRQQVLVYYWYQSRGRVVASDYWNRLLLVQDALKLHRSDGALVRVTVPVEAGRPTTPPRSFARCFPRSRSNCRSDRDAHHVHYARRHGAGRVFATELRAILRERRALSR